jgi:hypothetical protein
MEAAGYTVVAGFLAIPHHDEVELSQRSIGVPRVDHFGDLPRTRDDGQRDSLRSILFSDVAVGKGDALMCPNGVFSSLNLVFQEWIPCAPALK